MLCYANIVNGKTRFCNVPINGLVAGSDKWACRRFHIGAKEVKFHKEILLFCDLNSIYSGIDLKLWNIKENDIFFDILKFQKNQVSQLLVHATASGIIIIY
jgi:hypothetical protein